MCIKVLLADDTAVMRNAIRTLLGGEPEIELVAEAENFAESLSMTCLEMKDVTCQTGSSGSATSASFSPRNTIN
jgi:DNA-binding NarL/FixJ family response regulator